MASSITNLVTGYDPLWTSVYESLSEVLFTRLGSEVNAFEHIGSTAVPGLSARPVVDIDIVLKSARGFRYVRRILLELGYEEVDYSKQASVQDSKQASSDHLLLRLPAVPQCASLPPHDLYVVEPDSVLLKSHLKFRNYLRESERETIAFAGLKTSLAERFSGDAAAYALAKGAYIAAVLQRIES